MVFLGETLIIEFEKCLYFFIKQEIIIYLNKIKLKNTDARHDMLNTDQSA